MKRHLIAWVMATVVAVPAMATHLAAELILTGGRVRTPSGWAEAVAVRDGVIIAVGTAEEVNVYRVWRTQVDDLRGDTLLPGLHDTHVHPLYAGLSEQRCRIEQGSDLKQLQASVRACAARAAPGAWITGGQWDASALGRVPDSGMLDAVSPDNPVLLVDTSGHSSLANTPALRAAGITRDTPNPPGGIIERDSRGEPTGVFREEALVLAAKPVPPPTDEEVRAAIKWATHEMLSHGITSFTEADMGFAAGGDREIRAYAALADSGELKQRARLCISWAPGDPAKEATVAARNVYARDRVDTDCVKIVLDGVPTDSHTAAMLEPYGSEMVGRTDDAARFGMLLVEPKVLNEAVMRFDRMGLAVKFHAAGDAAVRASLDAIEAARTANGFSGLMHDVAHCTFVAQADVGRAREIGATFEVSPYLWSPSPINNDIIRAIGDARMDRVWPVKELLESGALVVPGSDWSVVPSASPWIGLETLVTRERPGGSPDSYGKNEAITLKQAFDMFTVNAARYAGAGHLVGRIEPGMLADVIVVNQNPFEVPVTQVHATRVKRAYIGGERVYDALWSVP
ncbi:MAG: amidohydrolase [Gammaproteobacteria bacterium]|nr:amidohydrolase [Gammaproteobacteria bacterium]